MVSLPTYFVGNTYILNGKEVTCIAETDSGNLKVKHADGREEWTTFDEVRSPILALALAA